MNELQHTKFQDYFKGLTERKQRAFAKRAKTTLGNIKSNYLRPERKEHPDHRKCFKSTNAIPNTPEKFQRLAAASKGVIEYEDMIDHFMRL